MTDKDKEIVQLVTERTEKGTLDWKSASKDQSAFSVRVGTASVIIRRQLVNLLPVIKIEVYDSQGNRLETIGGTDWQRHFSDLFVKVRRKALRIDESLETLISDLRSD